MQRGDHIILHVPENPTLHGAPGVIDSLSPWGTYIKTPAAATGSFRALFSEMVPVPAQNGGYTGDVCPTCQGGRMRRNGMCLLCDDCGSTTGCS